MTGRVVHVALLPPLGASVGASAGRALAGAHVPLPLMLITHTPAPPLLPSLQSWDYFGTVHAALQDRYNDALRAADAAAGRPAGPAVKLLEIGAYKDVYNSYRAALGKKGVMCVRVPGLGGVAGWRRVGGCGGRGGRGCT